MTGNSKRRGGAGKHGEIARRDVLKTMAGAAAASLAPPFLSAAVFGQDTKPSSASPPPPAKNPAWYGFNLLEYFSTDPDWMKYFPYQDDGMFQEDDFRWIRDWGFNWVRLPMDYRFWTDPNDLMKIDEKKVAPIDRAIGLGQKYSVHVNICLHRAPGYSILDIMDEKLTGIHITKEKTDLFTDPKTLDAFVYQWTFFADRYKGIPSERLSFNLMNEPLLVPSAKEWDVASKDDWEGYYRNVLLREKEREYVRVAKAGVDAIRAKDPARLIITDGWEAGNMPISDLIDTGIMQSAHTYMPMPLTHYRCEWARGSVPVDSPPPTWPLKDKQGKVVCDRSSLDGTFAIWESVLQHKVPIHFGEMGCYKYTPPEVVYQWYGDTLGAIGSIGSGWALWNFRGPFGILDTEREGTKFEDWHGHQLDRTLLQLLQSKMKSA